MLATIISVAILAAIAAVEGDVSKIVYDEVDLVEINHRYSEDCGFLFDQVIFWNFDSFLGEYVVVDWRNIKDGRRRYEEEEFKKKKKEWDDKWEKIFKRKDNLPNFEPPWIGTVWQSENGTIFVIDQGIMRRIRCHQFRETSTWYDPEFENREIFPFNNRRKLSRPLEPRKANNEVQLFPRIYHE